MKRVPKPDLARQGGLSAVLGAAVLRAVDAAPQRGARQGGNVAKKRNGSLNKCVGHTRRGRGWARALPPFICRRWRTLTLSGSMSMVRLYLPPPRLNSFTFCNGQTDFESHEEMAAANPTRRWGSGRRGRGAQVLEVLRASELRRGAVAGRGAPRDVDEAVVLCPQPLRQPQRGERARRQRAAPPSQQQTNRSAWRRGTRRGDGAGPGRAGVARACRAVALDPLVELCARVFGVGAEVHARQAIPAHKAVRGRAIQGGRQPGALLL